MKQPTHTITYSGVSIEVPCFNEEVKRDFVENLDIVYIQYWYDFKTHVHLFNKDTNSIIATIIYDGSDVDFEKPLEIIKSW